MKAKACHLTTASENKEAGRCTNGRTRHTRQIPKGGVLLWRPDLAVCDDAVHHSSWLCLLTAHDERTFCGCEDLGWVQL